MKLEGILIVVNFLQVILKVVGVKEKEIIESFTKFMKKKNLIYVMNVGHRNDVYG